MSFISRNIEITPIDDPWPGSGVALDVLRLDRVHPVVSGNKWFKLEGYLARAKEEEKHCLLTFGGAYSNHIVATAALCRAAGLNAIGIIRGEAGVVPSATLNDARRYGMELYFVSRAAYQLKAIPAACREAVDLASVLVVKEGGYGREGAGGIETLFRELPIDHYSHVFVATGTGTTLAGIAAAARNQQVTGISPFKNNASLKEEINLLLPEQLKNGFRLEHRFHFGGYAKFPPALLSFMNEWFSATGVPSDIIYTGKLFYAINEMAKAGTFSSGSRLLAVHTGGLQGNRSLKKGTLIFDHL